MQKPIHPRRSSFFFITACLLLTTMLTACNIGGNSNKAVIKRPTPTVAPLKTYQGDGYTIQYPQGWAAKGKGSLVTFAEAQGLTVFIVEQAPNPNGVVPPIAAVDGGLSGLEGQGTNFQKVAVAPFLTLGGTTWYQGQAVADATANRQTINMKLGVLASDYPRSATSTRAFTLIYATPTQEFAKTYMQYFEPMLQSFKFL